MNLKINMPKIDLNPQDWNEICHVLRKHVPEYSVWAFGSRVKWTAKAYSDLDLAIITQQPLSLTRMASIKEAFDDSNLSIRVDIVDWATTSETFRKIIEQDKVVVQKGEEEFGGISSKWVLTSIDELKASTPGSIAIGPFGSRMKSDCYVPYGVRVVRGTNLMTGRKFSGEFVFISEDKAKELGSSNLQPNDLVFPHRGSIGEVGIVPDDGEHYVLSSSLMKLSCDTTKAAPLFIYYYFKSSFGRYELLKNASQVGTPGIGQPLTSLKAIKLRLPPIKVQQEIATILVSLDDRIALLRETNATLEAIAQALFKSWFVDFDPVRARQQGRDPEGMDAETAALFPDSFEESELGLVPMGWKTKKINEICDLGRGSSPRPIQKFLGGEVPWIKIADATASDGMFVFETKEKIIHEGVRNSIPVKPGDLIMSNSASCGIPVFVELEGCIHDGWLYFKNYQYVTKNFLFFWLRKIAEHLINIADGSVQKNLNIALVSAQPILCPSTDIVMAFENVTSPILLRIRENCLQMQSLSNIRDTLLPRLISGQLRLPEAETLFEEVK